MYAGTLCELDEDEDQESQDLANLRAAVETFDELYEKCTATLLEEAESQDLNDLYAELDQLEETFWQDAHPSWLNYLRANLDTDFPMIRYKLNMLDLEM